MKNEVKVNVLNQPYGGFPWIDLPMTANENWYNAHNFYGDLAHLDAATLEDVRAFFKTFYAPNNAVLVVTGDFAPDQTQGVDRRSTSATCPRRSFRRRPICGAATGEGEARRPHRSAREPPGARRSATTCPIDSRQSGSPSGCSTRRSPRDRTRCSTTNWCGRRASPAA